MHSATDQCKKLPITNMEFHLLSPPPQPSRNKCDTNHRTNKGGH